VGVRRFGDAEAVQRRHEDSVAYRPGTSTMTIHTYITLKAVNNLGTTRGRGKDAARQHHAETTTHARTGARRRPWLDHRLHEAACRDAHIFGDLKVSSPPFFARACCESSLNGFVERPERDGVATCDNLCWLAIPLHEPNSEHPLSITFQPKASNAHKPCCSTHTTNRKVQILSKRLGTPWEGMPRSRLAGD
jgi:hypothetical protein